MAATVAAARTAGGVAYGSSNARSGGQWGRGLAPSRITEHGGGSIQLRVADRFQLAGTLAASGESRAAGSFPAAAPEAAST
jgi:hypothetical protein